MELIRLLLIEVEGEEPKPDLSQYAEAQQFYHLALLIEAGLAHGTVNHDEEGMVNGARMFKLTWAGHEFLDASRNETIWKKAGKKIKDSGISVGFDLLKTILTEYAKEQLGRPQS